MLDLARWPLIFIGLAIIFRIRKRTKHWRHKVLFVLIAVLVLEVLYIRITKEGLDSADEQKDLSFMTYNVFFKNKSKSKSVQLIHTSKPDVVFLQEITPGWEVFLNQNLKGYPYRKVRALRGTQGIAIYSKYPISDVKYLNNGGGLPYAQLATIKIGKRKIRVGNVHLASPAIAVENSDRFYHYYSLIYDLRKTQYATLKSEMLKSTYSKQLLVGDFNTPAMEPLYRDITSDWCDLYVQSGEGLGWNFPNVGNVPVLTRLDYAMAKGPFESVAGSIVKGGGSDHLPLIFQVKY